MSLGKVDHFFEFGHDFIPYQGAVRVAAGADRQTDGRTAIGRRPQALHTIVKLPAKAAACIFLELLL